MEYLVRSPIDLAALLSRVAAPGLGGTVLFTGSVRHSAEDGPVVSIEYSAYEEMAGAEFERILEEAALQWPDARLAGQHRIGVVPAGEPSIAIVAAAPHREDAFAACRFVIEAAKQRLPVWKKERFEDGSVKWREADRDQPGRVPGGG